MPDSNSDILKEIRDTHQYDSEQWRPIRDEGREDMKCLLGDPWEEKERELREAFNRPVLALDELHQYVNQLLNTVRKNKRSIKVIAQGTGANDKTAQLRENRIRRIEYDCNAQSAYITAFEGAVQRSYGVFRINTAYESEESFDQKIVIRRYPNPETVIFDWNCKEVDCSDAEHLTELDYIPKNQFKRRFGSAKIQSFTAEHMRDAPNWIRSEDVLVAGYWKVKKTPRKLLLIDVGTKEHPKPMTFLEDALDRRPGPVLKTREVFKREVVQYVTNGIELLEENPWAGQWIPFVPVFGRELYVDDGSGSKRNLLSLIRLARDPYMLYCWIRSNMAEAVGQSPKSLYLGYEGQFETGTDWENIARSPTVYATVKAIADPTNPGQVLPLPRREQYDPPLQSLELFAEGARRSIQAAMGITPLPTAAQRQNEKSGIALQKINEQEDEGTFHFVDNLDIAIRFGGIQVNDLLDKIEDTAADKGFTRPDQTHEVLRLHDPEWTNPKSQQIEHNQYGPGAAHAVTVSTGPSQDSEREAANDFADTIWQNVEQLPLDPQTKGKFLALLIKLRNLGAIGDQMAEILSPSQGNPQQALAQAQQNIAQQTQAIQEMQAELQKLRLEKAGKVIDNEYKLQMQEVDRDLKLLIAEVSTKAQDQSERMEAFMTFWKENHGAAHEAGMQASDQAHERDMTAAGQSHEKDMAATQAALNPPAPAEQPQA